MNVIGMSMTEPMRNRQKLICVGLSVWERTLPEISIVLMINVARAI